MTKVSNKAKHLEMQFSARSGYYLIQPTEGSLMKSAKFPADKQILQLAEKAGLRYCSFHVFPRRPEAPGFMLYVGSGSTPKQRETFLVLLEAESEFTLRTFSDKDLKKGTGLLAQSPLYGISVSGEDEWSLMTMTDVVSMHAKHASEGQVRIWEFVLELIGSSLVARPITPAEIAQINGK